MKFTDAEAAEIMATAHAHVRRWRDENWQQRDDADRFVCKTIDNARPVPAEPTTVTPVARTDFAAS